MLLAMKEQNMPHEEVKIRTVYIEENKSSHFRAVRDSWRIYKLILAHFFKYTLSSLASSVVDEGLFVVLTWLLQNTLKDPLLTAIPFVVARLISSFFNFFVNKKFVFDTSVSTGKAMAKYFALVVPQAVAHLVLTYGAYLIFNIAPDATFLRGLIYAIVMTALFFASFVIQQRWVFTGSKKK
jgi:dolichol-phosphate mannosyltransferase